VCLAAESGRLGTDLGDLEWCMTYRHNLHIPHGQCVDCSERMEWGEMAADEVRYHYQLGSIGSYAVDGR
jgi:hypothetical protein